MNMLHFRGPGDDWDPQGYDDAGENTEELNKLGMHTSDDEKKNDDKDNVLKVEDELDEDKKEVKEEEEEDEAEDVDDLKELERMEKKLKEESLGMGDADEE